MHQDDHELFSKNHEKIIIFVMINIMLHLYDLEESASHPSPSPRGSAPSGSSMAQGSALTRNDDIPHGSKNLLQRVILYRHKKIYLYQGRLRAI